MEVSLSLIIALAIVIFLIGIIIGSFTHKHVSGRLVIDESGETELWSFIMDDSIDKVKSQRYICLRIEKRE
jgi:hypothetical protein